MIRSAFAAAFILLSCGAPASVAAAANAPFLDRPAAKAERPSEKAVSKAVPTSDYLGSALQELSAGDAAVAARPEEKPGSILLKVVFDLILVCLLLVAFLFGLRFLMKRKAGGVPAGEFVRVLDVAHIAPKKTIYLLEIADRVLVVGSAGETLTLLSEIRDKEAVEKLRTGDRGGLSGSFLSALSQVARRTPPAAPDRPAQP